MKSNQSQSLTHLEQIVLAAERGDLNEVERVLSQLGPGYNARMGAEAAIKSAIVANQPAIVKFLIPRCHPNTSRSEPLKRAAELGFLDIVNLLLPVSDPLENQSDALRRAAHNGHLAVVERLIPLSNPKGNQSDSLSLAADRGHLEVVEKLIPVSNPLSNQSRALTMAVYNGHTEVVKALLPVSNPSHAFLTLVNWGQLSKADTLSFHVSRESLGGLNQVQLKAMPNAQVRRVKEGLESALENATATFSRERPRI